MINKKTLSAPEIPLCINVLRLLFYRLAPDEVVLFDWLVVKQIAFHYKPFHYSQMRVEEETRIHRTRQEVIIQLFTSLGFLTTQVEVNAVTHGRVRYYSVNFNALADEDVLMEIIQSYTTLFHDFQLYFKYHAEQQKISRDTSLPPAENINYEASNSVYETLNETYEDRRVFYNEGKLTGKEPERKKSAMQLQRNKPIERKMSKLAERYNNHSIGNAFIAYLDDVFQGKNVPDNLMYYFLSYDETTNAFGVVDHYLNNYTLNYTYVIK